MFSDIPLSGFHFSVIFELLPQFSIDSKFQSVVGLKSTMATETVAEGGQNKFSYELPTGNNYDNLVLKRGLSTDISGLRLWCFNALENFVFHPANLVVSLLNQDHEPVKAWYVSQAIPTSIEYSNFNAEESSIVIETFILKYQHFKELPIL